MSQAELERLVRDLAARPERWAHLVEHRADARTYAELHRDEDVAVWLICWMNDHGTGYHDHDLSAGAVAVAAGAVREERLVLGGAPARRSPSRPPTSTASATPPASRR
jgi:Cysteine dioxygenase type I